MCWPCFVVILLPILCQIYKQKHPINLMYLYICMQDACKNKPNPKLFILINQYSPLYSRGSLAGENISTLDCQH